MPAPSNLATRLAEDLVEIGKMFGFEAEKEQTVQDGSKFRIDVFWKMKMPEESPFPEINLVSIEIQYSDSISSISHGIFKAEKTLHPAIHCVVSYFKLTDDYKENILKTNYPRSGLVILDGEEEVRKLNLWITRLITNREEEKKLAEKGKKIRNFVISQSPNTEKSEMKERIRENFQSEIEEVFLPPEISSLIETFVEFESKDLGSREIIDDVYGSFIKYVQSKMEEYNIPRIYLEADSLFREFNMEPEFSDISFHNQIEIETSRVIIRDTYGVACDVRITDGNANIESPEGDVICIEGLYAGEGKYPGDIIHFFKEASKEIQRQIRKYNISKDDKKVLDAIKKALS